MTVLSKARAHQDRILRVEREALRVARRGGLTSKAVALAHFKFMAATDGMIAVAEQLHAQNISEWPDGMLDVEPLAPVSVGGGPLLDSVARGYSSGSLALVVATEVTDTARQGASLQIAATPRVGYVRMVEGGACSRCVVMAGKWFRWNQGFMRHPRCRCTHIPAAESRADDLRVDPYQYFESLSVEEQDKVFTKAGAQAIRDGADISQVVNARSGMTPNGFFTTTGTTRGHASTVLRPGQRRMTPELIYRQAGGNREIAQQLLRDHGYLLPEGQVAGGAIVGQREGYGALGGGGRRKAASSAVEEARRTGVRDPNNRYTMTAAERRLHDARVRYETALRGVDPYTSPGFSNIPDPSGARAAGARTKPATARTVETARKDYLRWFNTNGQIYTQ